MHVYMYTAVRYLQIGPFWTPIWIYLTLTITLVRARAYNDCAQDAVLLKTASNRGIGPQNGPILGS